jgi:hypothetical protein
MMQAPYIRSAKTAWKLAFPFILAVFFFSPLNAQEACSVEIKLLLSPASIKSTVSSLDFGKPSEGEIYFFDTASRSLLAQGVIIRIRQGAKNDITVKIRLPEENDKAGNSTLGERFACEIDRTETGASRSYSFRQKYKDGQIPYAGDDLFSALSSQQRELLKKAHVSIDWSNVKRVSSIHSTTWETSGDLSSQKITLEYWEFSSGSVLELSTKSTLDDWESKSAELHRIVKLKGLALSPNQQTKTTAVLKGSTYAVGTHE